MAGSRLGRIVRLTRPGLAPIRQAVNTTVRKTAGATARSMKNVAKKSAEAIKRIVPRITKEKYGVEKIGLGRWDKPNEESFWQAIVDKRGAHHLSSSGKTPHRQKLALGDEAFAKLPLTSIKEAVKNIPKLTARYLYKKNPKKILADLTNIDSARKTPNYIGKAEGYFAREELRILLSDDKLFNKTQFFFKGKPLWRYGIINRKNVRKFAVKQFYGRK